MIASVDFHFSYDVVGRSGVFVLDVSTYMYIYINYMYISIYFRLLITYRYNKYSSMISLCLPQLHAHLIHHISVHLLLRYTFMSWKKKCFDFGFPFLLFNWIQLNSISWRRPHDNNNNNRTNNNKKSAMLIFPLLTTISLYPCLPRSLCVILDLRFVSFLFANVFIFNNRLLFFGTLKHISSFFCCFQSSKQLPTTLKPIQHTNTH